MVKATFGCNQFRLHCRNFRNNDVIGSKTFQRFAFYTKQIKREIHLERNKPVTHV